VPKPILTNEPVDEYLIRYGVPFVPRLIERARGTLIWDEQGRELLDFTSGQMCATVGHNHPRIVQAIAEACEGALHLLVACCNGRNDDQSGSGRKRGKSKFGRES